MPSPLDLCGRPPTEDQRLVARHSPQFRRGFCLCCPLLSISARTAAAGSGIGIHVLSDHVNREITGRCGRGRCNGGTAFGIGIGRATDSAHASSFQTGGPASATGHHPGLQQLPSNPTQARGINGRARSVSSRPPARSSNKRPAAVGTAAAERCNPQHCWGSIH